MLNLLSERQKTGFGTNNGNLYHYAANNPVRYIDPDGRQTSDEIMTQIKILQQEMSDCQNKGCEITSSQYEMFIDLACQYNNAVIREGKLSKDDYVSGGRITTEFEEAQDAVGNYQVNFHSGIDIVGGDLKSPFFMLAINGEEKGSNGKVFQIIGTDLRMNVLHGDAGSVKKSGDFFKPSDVIMPFPKKNNFRLASTGPHFHIELSNGSNYVNPFTLKTSSSEFKRTTDGGKSWKSDDEEFFVYLDYDKDSVYFLWNHAFPDPVFYDTELKRASEIFNDEYNRKRQQEFEGKLKKSVLESLKHQIKIL